MPSAIVLLLVVGGLGGVNFILGKMAADQGVGALSWALLISAGAAASIATLRPRTLALPQGRARRYVLLSGLVSFALANFLVYALIPRLGAGYVGLMFALSPVATLTVSALVGTGRPGAMGLWGIATGFSGAVLIVLGGGEASTGVDPVALLLGLSIPLVLAIGNVYRTLDWPDGSEPDALAVWAHLSAAAAFLLVFLVQGTAPLADIARAPALALVQVIVAGLTFPAYFRLQKSGGPVMLSQIGYVSAAVGLVGATVILGERYGGLAWIGAAIVASGIALTILEARKPTPCSP